MLVIYYTFELRVRVATVRLHAHAPPLHAPCPEQSSPAHGSHAVWPDLDTEPQPHAVPLQSTYKSQFEWKGAALERALRSGAPAFPLLIAALLPLAEHLGLARAQLAIGVQLRKIEDEPHDGLRDR